MVWPARPCSSRAAPGLRDSSMLDTLWPRELRVFFLRGALSVTQSKLFLPRLEMRPVHAAVALLSFCLVFVMLWRTSLRIGLRQWLSVGVAHRSSSEFSLLQNKARRLPFTALQVSQSTPFMETQKKLSSCYMVKGIL